MKPEAGRAGAKGSEGRAGPLAPEDVVEEWVARALAALEREPLRALFPPDRVAAAIRAALSAPDAPERGAARFRERFDEVTSRLRASGESVASLAGPAATGVLVRAAGALEPDEAFVRALFGGPAAEALAAALLYDGIVEFVKRVQSIGDALPGMALARRLGGGVLAGLAGSLGAGIEAQVKAFLQGFVKVALERAVAFATAPANRPLFREARERIARFLLERPAREILAAVPEERLRAARDAAAEAIRQALEALGGPAEGGGSAEALAARVAEALGDASAASLAERYGLVRLEPADATRLLAPAVRRAIEAARQSPASSEKSAPVASS